MTIQQPIEGAQLNILPETAPFSKEQRAWLNGFFAGMLSLDVQTAAAAAAAPSKALSPDGDDGETPWHDASIAITERMKLAEGRPQRRKLFAAMAQQNCGQCGYQCESYAEALAKGEEQRANLCVPGGKDTSRMLKQLLEAAPAAAPAVASGIAAHRLSKEPRCNWVIRARRRLLRRSAVRHRSAVPARRRTRVTSCSTSRSQASTTCRVTASA